MTINGFPGLKEQGRKYTRDPVRGLVTEILYEGLKEACLAAYQTIGAGMYVECDTLRAGPTGTLFLRTPDYGTGSVDTAPVITTYDLIPNSSQRSAYENPRFSEEMVRTVKNSIRDATSSGTQPSLTGDTNTLYEYMISGVDTYFLSEIIFRITTVIANGYQQSVAYSNTNRIFTTAQLITEVNTTAFYQAGINAAAATWLADVYGGSIPAGLVLGWLKQFPGTMNVPGNKSAVTIDYWLGAWPTLYYYQAA